MHDDDLFCILATVADQCQSPPHEINPVLITNDCFRDHEMVIADSELFREWYNCHCYKHHLMSGDTTSIPPVSSRKRKVQNDGSNDYDENSKPGDLFRLYEQFVAQLYQWFNFSSSPENDSTNNLKPSVRIKSVNKNEATIFTPEKKKQVYEDILAFARDDSQLEKELKKLSTWLT